MLLIMKQRVAILGASGYTGIELVRLLLGHPHVELVALGAERNAGQPLAALYPHLLALPDLPPLIRTEEMPWDAIDVVFCCLPHATTQAVVAQIPSSVVVIDLSADFRLRDPAIYETWYGHPHQAIDLQQDAVYGLSEWARDAVRSARLIANPGCYPTSAQLPLIPLLRAGAIRPSPIIIDAKSGVSGAGRKAQESLLYTEITDSMHAYSVGKHRHLPEIEQGLSDAAGAPVSVSFTPHLIPMTRGILSTLYVWLEAGWTVAKLRAVLSEAYADEPFVHLLPEGLAPATRMVRGTNHCLMNLFADQAPDRVILVSVIDNLVKGASGQAVHNFNLRFGHPETTGLEAAALIP
jgi:N-acetyl-gamma-glutamyl-phosphate reductase